MGSQMTDLFSPDLLFDLGFYYSELDGIGRKYLRYIVFVEDQIPPGMKENARLRESSACLVVRLETPMQSGKSCIPNLAQPVTNTFD